MIVDYIISTSCIGVDYLIIQYINYQPRLYNLGVAKQGYAPILTGYVKL